MTIQNLCTFIEITKDMNLSKTADRLFTTQQSLSGHIRRLERHYGVYLFNRSPRLTLTNAGTLLLHEAKIIVDAENRLCDAFSTQRRIEKHAINVACSIDRLSPIISQLISEMEESAPGVSINTINYAEFWGQHLLSNGSADFVITDIYTDDAKIVSEKLTDNFPCLVVSKKLLSQFVPGDVNEFVAAASRGIDLSDVPDGLTMACISRASGIHSLGTIKELAHLPRIYIDPSSNMLRVDLCIAGKAAVIVTKLFYECHFNYETDNVVCLPLLSGGAPLLSPEHIYYRADTPLTRYQQIFLDTVRRLFSELPKEMLA